MRVNPLATCGSDDLAAVLAGRPDVVMMSKVAAPEGVRALDATTGGDAFQYRVQLGELGYVTGSRTASTSLAEDCVGLPLD